MKAKPTSTRDSAVATAASFQKQVGNQWDESTFPMDSCDLLPAWPLPAEATFYGGYSWCLNASPTIREVVVHLTEELSKLELMSDCWQRSEVIANVYLLACALTDTVDDYLAGASYDFSKVSVLLPWARPAVGAVERMLAAARTCRGASLLRLRRWRDKWAAQVTEFLAHTIAAPGDAPDLQQQCSPLAKLVPVRLPAGLWNQRSKIPAFFRSRDFTPWDCLELGRRFLLAYPECKRPVMVMGLRTAGSYLAPLLCALLRTRGDSRWVAVRPKQGLTGQERAKLQQAARENAVALIVDESIHSGRTLTQAVELVRQTGFRDEDIAVLNPVEPAFPRWRDSRGIQSLTKISFVVLEPWQRHKQQFLEKGPVERRLKEYFLARGYREATLVTSPEVEELNREWAQPPERVDIRLKRIYKVRLEPGTGGAEFRFVLAKSVGWGWLGYHAFIAGRELAPFVPTVLGLWEGILYSEWLPDGQLSTLEDCDRGRLVDCLAGYLATRSLRLRMKDDPARDLGRQGRLKGFATLASSLCRACNSRSMAAVQRRRIERELANEALAAPVLSDSKMSRSEWLVSGSRLLKVDFEHHGQGKNELGMTDPAFDLAGAIYYFGLSEAESTQLVHHYIEKGGDPAVERRLFWNKLLAGLWAQNLAALGLENRRLFHRREESHQQYVSSWNFLVLSMLRECGKLCQGPAELSWRSPLVVTDIDGVLDRMVFGFPSTTAAGIKAISLLHAHGFPIVANTARSLPEVKEYCSEYHFVGAVAEYGAVVWDALSAREFVVVSRESREELREASRELRQIPGVFLNGDYRYSLRAYTFQNGRTVPLPTPLVQDLLASRKLDRLEFHQTGLDTAITARETNKGVGLSSLFDLVGAKEPSFLAIGDSEPDLAMFRLASRSFAPGNVSCGREARLLGSYIADAPYQPGLLQIARKIVHPPGGACDLCRAVEANWPKKDTLFVSLLELADKKSLLLSLKSLLSPSLWTIFRQ